MTPCRAGGYTSLLHATVNLWDGSEAMQNCIAYLHALLPEKRRVLTVGLLKDGKAAFARTESDAPIPIPHP